MTEQEFEVILHELKHVRRAISEAVQQIVHQETEINALRLLLEERGVASADELADASVRSGRELQVLLGDTTAESVTPSTTILSKRNRRMPYICRPGS